MLKLSLKRFLIDAIAWGLFMKQIERVTPTNLLRFSLTKLPDVSLSLFFLPSCCYWVRKSNKKQPNAHSQQIHSLFPLYQHRRKQALPVSISRACCRSRGEKAAGEAAPVRCTQELPSPECSVARPSVCLQGYSHCSERLCACC